VADGCTTARKQNMSHLEAGGSQGCTKLRSIWMIAFIVVFGLTTIYMHVGKLSEPASG